MRVWRGTQSVLVALVLLALAGCALLGIAPSVTVLQGSTEYKQGDAFDYGNGISPGQPVSVDFTVRNTGTWELDLRDASAVQISGADPSYFTLDTVPATSITPGSTGDLSISFTPAGYGGTTYTANVTITAADGTTFTFTLTGSDPLG